MSLLLKIAGALIATTPLVYGLYKWISAGPNGLEAEIGFSVYVLPFLALIVIAFGMLLFNLGKMIEQGRSSKKSDRF